MAEEPATDGEIRDRLGLYRRGTGHFLAALTEVGVLEQRSWSGIRWSWRTRTADCGGPKRGHSWPSVCGRSGLRIPGLIEQQYSDFQVLVSMVQRRVQQANH
jgi:hypothetical protein